MPTRMSFFLHQNFDRLQKDGEIDYLTDAAYYIEVEHEYEDEY